MNATASPVTPADRKEITETAASAVLKSDSYVVDSDASYEGAAEILAVVKGAQKALAAKKKKLTDPIKATLKAVNDLFDAPETELEQAEGKLKRQVIAWRDGQEEKRRAEQRRLDDEARKVREAAEAKARKAEEDAAAARRQAAQAASEDERAKLLAKAERAEAKQAQQEEVATTVVAATAQTQPPKVAGLAMRENWSAVVVSLPELVKAVAEGRAPITCLEANMKFLNNQAKAMKKELSYPGVRPVRETIAASGAR